jgi:hypothetical protein
MKRNNSEKAKELARQVLEDSIQNLKVSEPEPGSGREDADLVAVGRGPDCVVNVSYLPTVRIKDLIGSIAATTLTATRIANATEAEPVVVAVAPRIGSTAVHEVQDFMRANAPDVGWGLVDYAGRVRLYLPSQGLDVDRQPARLPEKSASKTSRSLQLFSDLNRWLLKVLLMRESPEGMWGGQRERVDSPTQLGAVASVSTAKAHRFFRAFEERDFLRRTPEGLKVVRRRALINAWMAEEDHQHRVEMPVRCIFGKPTDVMAMLEPVADQRFAISAFEACRLHDVLHTTSPRLSVYVEDDFREFMEAWELADCDSRDAHLVLVRPRFPESVFRGTVQRKDLPVVDVLQAALDVRSQKPRGGEQADFIIDHVLKWRDEE